MSIRPDFARAAGLTAWPIVYYKPGCPFGLRLRALLRLQHVPFVAVRLRDDEVGAAAVRDVNNGNEVSPTVRIGTVWLTNPSWRAVADAVERTHGTVT